MTWNLLIIGDSTVLNEPLAVLSVDVSDHVHDYPAAADTVEQLVCEQFHDTYSHHCICVISWAYKKEGK